MPTPIEQLQPRELDALVATKIMEWEQRWRGNVPETNAPEFLYPPSEMFVADDPERVPPFSTDISAAWQVVEKLCPLRFSVLRGTLFGRNYRAEFWIEETGDRLGTGYNSSPARAICLAALRAVGVTEVEDD